MKNIIIVSQSLYQTIFWYKICYFFKKKNLNLLILCFDYESEKFLKNKNIDFVNIFKFKKKKSLSAYVNLCKKYKIKNLKDNLFHHINYYFKNSNKKTSCENLYFYLSALDELFVNYKSDDTIIIQELGGFTSNISCYFYAKQRGIKNFFIEPSFFLGHFHILKNTFECTPIKNINIEDNDFALNYIKKITQDKKINVPSKDKKQFVLPIKKIFDSYNFVRFLKKIYYKFVKKKNAEFNQPLLHVKLIIKNFISYFFLRGYYTFLKDIKDKDFIYFPLHVPNDIAITIRSREYYDQIKLINFVAKKINHRNIYLLIKEHPARVGSIDHSKIINSIKLNKNIIILQPKENSFDIISKSKMVITINSKTGFEAMALNRPLVCLGKSFYEKFDQLSSFENFCETGKLINYNQSDSDFFFRNLFKHTFEGDLYDCNESNIQKFSKSLEQILNYGFNKI